MKKYQSGHFWLWLLLTCCLSAARVMYGKTLTVTHADDDTSSTTTDKLQDKDNLAERHEVEKTVFHTKITGCVSKRLLLTTHWIHHVAVVSEVTICIHYTFHLMYPTMHC